RGARTRRRLARSDGAVGAVDGLRLPAPPATAAGPVRRRRGGGRRGGGEPLLAAQRATQLPRAKDRRQPRLPHDRARATVALVPRSDQQPEAYAGRGGARSVPHRAGVCGERGNGAATAAPGLQRERGADGVDQPNTGHGHVLVPLGQDGWRLLARAATALAVVGVKHGTVPCAGWAGGAKMTRACPRAVGALRPFKFGQCILSAIMPSMRSQRPPMRSISSLGELKQRSVLIAGNGTGENLSRPGAKEKMRVPCAVKLLAPPSRKFSGFLL